MVPQQQALLLLHSQVSAEDKAAAERKAEEAAADLLREVEQEEKTRQRKKMKPKAKKASKAKGPKKASASAQPEPALTVTEARLQEDGASQTQSDQMKQVLSQREKDAPTAEPKAQPDQTPSRMKSEQGSEFSQPDQRTGPDSVQASPLRSAYTLPHNVNRNQDRGSGASASGISARQEEESGMTAAEHQLEAAMQTGQVAHLQQAIRHAVTSIAAADSHVSLALVKSRMAAAKTLLHQVWSPCQGDYLRQSQVDFHDHAAGI
ncbi:hypothetical protein WJX74_006436 [Apatococcus lobatus]|uniref:Uncharacterized protein n=1 Tax=Apatococcus lobatus TaxID=904363 RepID=A0AAW1RYX0_9CHLO